MPKKKKLKKVKRCLEMYTDEVSFVTGGANGHRKFLMVKSDGDVGQIVEDVEKAVPAKDVDSETKKKAQKARSKKYGIEIVEGSNLSYPANAPTTERLYGDPVGLKYPLAYEDDTKPNSARTRNAIARFKQNYEAYTKKTSRARVYERIVRAAMSAKIEVSYDSNDPVDKLLPVDLKTRLQKSDDTPSTEPESTEAVAADSKTVDLDWLSDVEQSLKKSDDNWLDAASEVAASVTGDHGKKVGKDGAKTDDKPTKQPVAKSEPRDDDAALSAARKEADTLREESTKKDGEISKLKKAMTKLEATMARLQTSIGPPRSQKPGERETPDSRDDYSSISGSIDLSPEL